MKKAMLILLTFLSFAGISQVSTKPPQDTTNARLTLLRVRLDSINAQTDRILVRLEGVLSSSVVGTPTTAVTNSLNLNSGLSTAITGDYANTSKLNGVVSNVNILGIETFEADDLATLTTSFETWLLGNPTTVIQDWKYSTYKDGTTTKYSLILLVK